MIVNFGIRFFMEGWPLLHCIFKEKDWGKKLASEFLQSFVQHWASLPRKQVYFHVDPLTLEFSNYISRATERLEAVTYTWNLGSQSILRNSAF